MGTLAQLFWPKNVGVAQILPGFARSLPAACEVLKVVFCVEQRSLEGKGLFGRS